MASSSTSRGKGLAGTASKAKEPPNPLVERLRAFQRSTQANKRCADCVERGPTYVCTTFQTFVCQTCSGIHREFGHKIKSISLSAWTEADVRGVEAGGNDRAAKTWLAKWKVEDFPEPDSTDLDQIRDFIRQKYQDKRWFKEVSQPELDAAAAAASSAPVSVPPQNAGNDASLLPTSPSGDSQPSVSRAGSFGAVEAPAYAAAPVGTGTGTAKQPAEVADLLSGGFELTSATGAAPATNGKWADFGDGGAATVQAPAVGADAPVTTGSLFDLDMSAVAIPAAPSAPPAASKEQDPATAAVLAAAAEAAADANVGDRLRQAVLSGSTDEVARLFQKYSDRPAQSGLYGAPVHGSWATPAPANDRYSALSFGDIGGSGNSQRQLSSAMPLSSVQSGAAASNPASGYTRWRPGGASVASTSTSNPAPAFGTAPAGVAPRSATVAAGTFAEDAASGAAQVFYIGDEDSPGVTTAATDGSTAGAALPGLAQLSTQMPNLSGLTPQQLAQLNPQELLQMQQMIAKALQERGQSTSVGPPTFLGATPGAPAWSAATGGGLLDHIGQPTSPVSAPPRQFDDLLEAFCAKNSEFPNRVG